MKVDTVILTLPHSECLGKKDDIRSIRICDTKSKEFATKLKEKLESSTDITCHLIKSGQNRSIKDDNRYNISDITSNSPSPINLNEFPQIFRQQNFNKELKLWKKLREYTKNYYENHNNSFDGLIILDCHSFPESSDKNLDLYLIDYMDKINKIYSDLGNTITEYFNSYPEYRYDIKQGKKNFNSIIEISQSSQIPCVLIEILEQIDDDKFNKILDHFVEIITTYNIKTNWARILSIYYKFIVEPFNNLFGYPNITTITIPNVKMAIHCGFSDNLNYKVSSEIKQNLTKILKSAKINTDLLSLTHDALVNMEDSNLYNAGIGSVKTSSKQIEKEGIIVMGNGKVGSASLIPYTHSPIKISKCLIDNNSETVKLVGTGAIDYYTDYCSQNGGSYIDSNSLYGTIGCICIDSNSNLCAGSSTGGIDEKLPGRIGDSGIIGHGTYANNDTCAIACTGTGEYFSKQVAAYQVHSLYKNSNNLYNAVNRVLNNVHTIGGEGGIIALSNNNKLVISYTKSGSMVYGYITTNNDIYIMNEKQL